MPTLAELEEQRSKIIEEIWVIEKAEQKKAFAALVGKYLMYPRNCYSCPAKESDYWDVYCKVVGITDAGYLKCIEFEHTAAEEMNVKIREHFTSPLRDGCWREIPKAQYLKALRAFKKKLAARLELAN